MTRSSLLTTFAATALLLGAGQALAQDASAPAAAPVPAVVPAAPAMPMVVARGDIVETLRASGQFTTLIKALDATNLTSVLKDNQGLTLFAPTDAAFAALPAGELTRLMANPAELQGLLVRHLVNTTLESSRVEGTTGGVQTVGGDELMLDDRGETLMAGSAKVTQADIHATNGIVHVIDKVLVPGAEKGVDTAAAAPEGETTAQP